MKIWQKLSLNYHQISSNMHLISSAVIPSQQLGHIEPVGYLPILFHKTSFFEAVDQYLVPILLPLTDNLLFLNQLKRGKMPQVCRGSRHATDQASVLAS